MLSTSFRTLAACRIAGISKDRFNEAIHRGAFFCAPKTVPGASRKFDLAALITLFIYGRLLESGFQPERAGFYACMVSKAFESSPEAAMKLAEVTIVHGLEPDTFEIKTSTDHRSQPRRIMQTQAKIDGGSVYVFGRFSFDIENIRLRIARKIDEEMSIQGEDD